MTPKENQIQEINILEQNLQQLFLQKQAFNMELSETETALEEIKKSGDEIFKIVGQLMIKSEKKKIEEELVQKIKLLQLRCNSLDKQEKIFSDKIESIRKELIKTD